MNEFNTIGIIGGTGWLGRSIAAALLDIGFLPGNALTISGRSATPKDIPAPLAAAHYTSDNQSLVQRSDVIILSVRPEDLHAVQIDAGSKLLISLVAGASMQEIETHTGSTRTIRAMPNAALEIRRAYTPWFANAQVDAAAKSFVQRLFEACGEADEVGSESDLNYLTALSGTGPAYPALLAQALHRHAIAQGLPDRIARRAVQGVVVGASQLMSADRGFEDLLAALRAYRGVSAAGIDGMLAAGFEESVNAGLQQAAATANSALATATRPDGKR